MTAVGTSRVRRTSARLGLIPQVELACADLNATVAWWSRLAANGNLRYG